MPTTVTATSYNLQTSLGQFSRFPSEIRLKIIGYLTNTYKVQPLVSLKQTSKGMKDHVDQVVKPDYCREIGSCYTSDAWKLLKKSEQELVRFHADFAEVLAQCKNLENDDSEMIKAARNVKDQIPAFFARIYLGNKLNTKTFVCWQELGPHHDDIDSPKQNTRFYCLARSILTEMSKNPKHPQQKVADSILQRFPRESAFGHYDHSIPYLKKLLQPIPSIDYESFTKGLDSLKPIAIQNSEAKEIDIKSFKKALYNRFKYRIIRPLKMSDFPTLPFLVLFVSKQIQYLGSAGLQFEQEHGKLPNQSP